MSSVAPVWPSKAFHCTMIGLASLAFVAGCKTTPEKSALSVEAAKKVAIELEDTTLAAPPRSLAGLGELPRDIGDLGQAPACVAPSEPVTAATVEKILNDYTSQSYRKYVSLRLRALEQERAGQLSNAILLIRESQKRVPANFHTSRGRNEVDLSRYLARAGEFRKAERLLDTGLQSLSRGGNESEQNCQRLNRMWRYRGKGMVAFAKGDLPAAEAHQHDALRLWEETWASDFIKCGVTTTYKAEVLLEVSEAVFWQGRFGEAETLARDAYRTSRKIKPQAALMLADIYYETGRFADSLRLALKSVQMLDQLCVPSDAYQRARSYAATARALIGLRRWGDAAVMFDRLEALLSTDPALWDGRFKNSRERGLSFLMTGRAADALAIFEATLQSAQARLGVGNYQTLEAEALAALAQAKLGRHEAALAGLRASFPDMVVRWRESGGDSVKFVGRLSRMRLIAETYLRLLLDAEMNGDPNDGARIAESFQIADAVGTRGVQRALAESTARVLADDPAASTLIRQRQDLERQVGALRGRLNDATLSPEVTEETLAELRNEVARAEAALRGLDSEVAAVVPDYAALTNPQPMTLPEAQSALLEGEALVLTFSGEDRLFVWAVPKEGAVQATVAPLGRADLKAQVDRLRQAMSPNVQILGDIPAYDVAAGYALYRQLLAPVEAAWQGRQRLLVVADGPLGTLPLAVLPTADVPLAVDDATLFDGYRQVPWLAREVAISRLPSVVALIALRRTAVDPEGRYAFVGFGDPWFDPTAEQVAVADTRGALRGGAPAAQPIALRSLPQTRAADTATLASLPRLPDTADEILAVAETLGANLDRDVYIGLEASERRVKDLNESGELGKYRTLSFATHGLVPGDLDGLVKPALAMAAPTLEEAEGGDDGLLTSDEILGLRLNADWAVLSACNTAAADGAGAEAVSGLGRAFFYAGAKAILVSNWPVHSDATRALMTELFADYAGRGNRGRAEALQAAMASLIDEGGFEADGQTVFSYAHPIFWAPFMIVGDGG